MNETPPNFKEIDDYADTSGLHLTDKFVNRNLPPDVVRQSIAEALHSGTTSSEQAKNIADPLDDTASGETTDS